MAKKTDEKKDRQRISMDVTEQVRLRLEDLAVRTDATSLAEVVKRALALYDLTLTHCSKGGKIVLQYPEGSQEVLALL
ncbi:MAG: ribbon-helix-helix protein, CopG family [Verrucomicrobiota bacterium]